MPNSDALQKQAMSYDPAMGPEELHRWAQQIKSAAAQEALRKPLPLRPADIAYDPWIDGVRHAISHLDPVVDKSAWDPARRERYEHALTRLRNIVFERERTNRQRHLQSRGRLPTSNGPDQIERAVGRLSARG